MRTKPLYLGMMAVGISVLLAASAVRLSGQQKNAAAVRIDNNDIGGMVTSANGPEAGVWVIAETTELPTKMAKIVITDNQGRYLLPDLPKANYSVWVRGYGLVDSPKVKAHLCHLLSGSLGYIGHNWREGCLIRRGSGRRRFSLWGSLLSIAF